MDDTRVLISALKETNKYLNHIAQEIRVLNMILMHKYEIKPGDLASETQHNVRDKEVPKGD